MKTLEHTEQVLLMKWWGFAHQVYKIPERLLFAIPNGGNRNVITAANLKAEGVRAGIPDLFLAVPRGGFGGLFIEMKKQKGGRVSDKQKTALSILEEQGYMAVVARGWSEARRTIENYLSQSSPVQDC